jgi:hypothetical protein
MFNSITQCSRNNKTETTSQATEEVTMEQNHDKNTSKPAPNSSVVAFTNQSKEKL